MAKKESFQDFSYRKFTELMDDESMSNFIDEVQKTCREVTSELDATLKSKIAFSAAK